MTFELNNASHKAFLVPNDSRISIKLRGEDTALDGWVYCGLDDEQMFMLLKKDDAKRWIPVSSISYIEQSN